MNDDDLIQWLRDKPDEVLLAADRIEALVAENAGLRAAAGRVPESWDECADWMRSGGVLMCGAVESAATVEGIERMIADPDLWNDPPDTDYRLLPPPNLVAAPPGMDGGGFLGAGADVPEGWEWRPSTGWAFQATDRCHWTQTLVQCRPPVKPAVRATVQVPLTKLVGRVIEGETEKVQAVLMGRRGDQWSSETGSYRPFPANTLDLDTGMVSVYAEDGES